MAKIELVIRTLEFELAPVMDLLLARLVGLVVKLVQLADWGLPSYHQAWRLAWFVGWCR